MPGKDEGYNEHTTKLERQIGCVKYTLFCFNVITWIFGMALFGLSVWVRAEPGFSEWVNILKIQEYYIGIYVLIVTGIIVMVTSFLGCLSALVENPSSLGFFIGTQVLSFILMTVGSAVLMEFSTMNSSIQPMIRDTMTRLIMTSEYPKSSVTLKMIQENVGCCGADGPNDYILLRQPLPTECRNTVTGNAFSYGCVDELTWFLEDKSGWIAGIAMVLAAINVVNAVMSTILIQAIKKEEEEARVYRS